MTLRFAYRTFQVPLPLVPLAGRMDRPRPVISVGVLGPSGSIPIDCLLDTGADDTVFPETVAQQIGIDLTLAPTGTGAGVGLQSLTVRYAEVTLRIADRHERREWTAWVGFTSSPLRHAILGYAGFLQFFTATFHGDLQEVELTVNGTYPGT